MTRIDPYKHKEKYNRWKYEHAAKIPNVSAENASLIRRYLFDMERGLNVAPSSKRGARSFIRLNTLRVRIPFLARKFNERFGINLVTDATEEQAHTLFSEMQSGRIPKQNGKPYLSVGDMVKDFKSFWHWYMWIKHKDGILVADITAYLVSAGAKPKWVYLTDKEVKQLCDNAKYEYRVLMMFLLDSGVRSPGELVNIRVRDFYDDYSKVHIREEVSKTFGRRINLMLCRDSIRDYVATKNLTADDIVFSICPSVTNRYLKRLAKRIFGESETLAGDCYCNLTMYDFRHIAACYWVPRYKSEAALKYRFGWKQTERIYYYTELLGMKDNIVEDDLLLDDQKTALETRLTQSECDKQILQDRLDVMQRQMDRISTITEKLLCRVGDKVFQV